MSTLRTSRVALTTIALAVSGSTTLLFNVVLARRLPVAGFGEVARTYSVALAVAQITMAAVAPAIAWRVAQEPSDARRQSLARASLGVLLAATAGASFLFPLAVLAGLAPSRAAFVAGGWLFAVVYPTYFGLKMLLFALDRARYYAGLELAADVVFAACLFVLAVVAPEDGMLAFSIAYGAFVLAAIAAIRASARVRRRHRFAVDRPLLRYGLLAGAATYASMARFPLAVVVTGEVAGSLTAGHVGAVVALAIPLFLVPQAAGLLTFASVARNDDDPHATVRQGVRAAAAGTAALVSAAIVLAPVVIPRLLGDRYAEIVGPFIVLLVCLVPQLVGTPIGAALAGQGAVTLSAAISVAGLLVALVGVSIGAADGRVDGAVLGIGVSAVLTGSLLLGVGRRRHSLRPADVLPVGIVPLAVAVEQADRSTTFDLVVGTILIAAALAWFTGRRPETLPAVRDRFQPMLAPLVALTASIALAAAIAFQPLVALAAGGIAVLALLVRFPPRYGIAALLVYLPFEEFVLTHFAGTHTAAVRYAPELAVDLVVLVAVLARVGDLVPRAARLLAVVSMCVVPWLLSALVSHNGVGTALIGLRSELRFAPLCFVPLLLADPDRDLRFLARVAVWVAAAQSSIALMEFFGGAPVRAFFAPNWRVELSGVTLAQSGPTRLGTVFGTFSNYNGLAIFLLLAWILLASAGSSSLGFSRRWGLALGSLLVVAIVLSGSREALAGLVLSALVIARRRFGMPVVRLVAVAVCGALLFAPALSTVRSTAPIGSVSYTSLVKRWHAVFSPAAWSATPHGNFRLYLLRSEFDAVKADVPLLGFGLGSVADPRRVADGSSAAYRTSAGRQAASFRYLFDGNWGLMLLETGFAGVAALLCAFALVLRFGIILSRQHWVGLAVTASVLTIGLLGFFAPVLLMRVPGALLWLVLGFAVAIRLELRPESEGTPLSSDLVTVG